MWGVVLSFWQSSRLNVFHIPLLIVNDITLTLSILPGSYAHKSGLQEGDYVLTVNGINTANMTVPTVNDRIKSVFTEGHVYIGICRLPPNEKLTDKHKGKKRGIKVYEEGKWELGTIGNTENGMR